MPDETDMPLPVIPVNLPDDTQATESVASAIVEAVVPPEAVAPSSAPVEEEKAPPEPEPAQETTPPEAPAVSDKLHATITVDTSAIAPLLADMQHELTAAHDAATNAQAAHDRIKAERDSLQQRLEESDAKVQALTEERDLLKAAQPA